MEWDIPNELEGDFHFNIYRSKSLEDPFFKINDNPIKTNTYVDEPEEEGEYVYMLRTVQLQETNSGSFYNLSHGLYQSLLVVGVEETEGEFSFECTPVPAIDNLTIKLNTSKLQKTNIEIYDMKGMLVYSVYEGNLGAGEHKFGWDLTDNNNLRITPGVYFAKFSSDNMQLIRKIIVIK